MTLLAITSGSAMAPLPTSPQASLLDTGGTTETDIFRRVFRCNAVNRLLHMRVFIAGATTTGLSQWFQCLSFSCQARKTHVRRLSQSPPAILAREFAESGATQSTS